MSNHRLRYARVRHNRFSQWHQHNVHEQRDDRHNEPTRRLDQQVNVTAHSRIRTRPGFNAFEQTRLVLSCSTAFAGDRTELGS